MKVFFASQSFYPHIGGVPTYLLNLLRELKKRGHDVKEFHLRVPGTKLEENVKGIEVTRIPQEPIKKELLEGYSKFKEIFFKSVLCQRKTFIKDVYSADGYKEFYGLNKSFGEEIASVLEANPAEIVHAHDFQMIYLYKYVPRGTPLVLTWHVPFYSSFSKELKDFLMEHMNHYDKVIFSSEEYRKNAIEAGLDEEKATVIYPIANTKLFKLKNVDRKAVLKRYGLPTNKKIILCVQRIDWRSSHEYLIKALKKILKKDKNVVLAFAGETSMSQKISKSRDHIRIKIDNLIKELKLENKIYFLGNVEYHKLPSLYNAVDFVGATPLMEGFGLSITEGMACGKPVVGTNVGGIPLQIVDGDNGFLVEPKDIDAIAKSFIKLLTDKKLRKRMEKRAVATVKEKFSITKRIQEHIILYKKLLKSKSDMWRLEMFEKEDIHAFISDLDGTLTKNPGQIPKSTIKALKSLETKTILSTGRSLRFVRELCRKTKAFDVAVAENGAIIYFPDSKKVIYFSSDPMRKARKKLENSDIECDIGDVLVSFHKKDKSKVKKKLGVALASKLDFSLNRDEYMLLPKGVNKRSGVMMALNHLEIDPDNTVLMGDAENDVPLFSIAGYKVAVANAVKDVKLFADEITKGEAYKGVEEAIKKIVS